MAPRTIAVVLNHQREALTTQCLQSLMRSSAPPEILIVDNASPDGSGERLRARFPEHSYLQTGGNYGYAGGNARGIAKALEMGAERVFVLNEDTEVAADCLALLHAALDADPAAAIAGPTILHEEPADRVWWAGGEVSLTKLTATHEGFGQRLAELPNADGPARSVTFICGCAMLFTAVALRELGGFREEFWTYAEDVEISLRYTRAGKRLLHVPQARMVHKVPFPEPPPTPRKIVLRDTNRRRIAKLHLSGSAKLRFYAFFTASRIALWARYAAGGDFSRAGAIVEGATAKLSKLSE